jgi:hypothetical protein
MLKRAVIASTSRDAYPSLSEEQYRDFLAAHYERVIKQAKRVRERLLEESDIHIRETYLPKTESLISFHNRTARDRETKAVTYDFWQGIILEIDREYGGCEAAERGDKEP